MAAGPRTPRRRCSCEIVRRRAVGVVAGTVAVAAATLAIYPLEHIAPYVSLSVVYLPAVLFVSAVWGLPLGLFTSLLSAAAFNFFHLPPVGEFTIADPRNWVALAAFTTVARRRQLDGRDRPRTHDRGRTPQRRGGPRRLALA